MRLDAALVARGMAGSRNRAAREISAGNVNVDGHTVTKAATKVTTASAVALQNADPWVARSAHKLLGALADLRLEAAPAGAVCLDAGASTGGFTQVLLHHDATRVHAIDVGHGQLDPGLAADPRVHELSGHNLRELTPDWLAPDLRADLVTGDVSFISLRLLLAPLLNVTADQGTVLLMVKPQFELGPGALDKHGVVTSATRRADAVAGIAAAAAELGATVNDWAPSRLPGPTGNREYFLKLAPGPLGSETVSVESIHAAIAEGS